MDQTRAVIRIIEEVLERELGEMRGFCHRCDGPVTAEDVDPAPLVRAIERELARRQVRITWGEPRAAGAPLLGGLA